MRIIIAALAMVLTATVANAQVAVGAGASTCGQLAEMYRKLSPLEVDGIFFTWAQGYMTELNHAAMIAQRNNCSTSATYRDLTAKSVDDQRAYIRHYCDEHPLIEYSDAVGNLYLTFPFATLKQ